MSKHIAHQSTAAQDDYSRTPVPQDRTYSGVHIALIIVGGVIGIPAFLQASLVGGSLGLEKATYAFMIGCLILGVLGGLTSYVGAKTRYSTYMLTEFSFGQQGAKLVNLVVAITLIGWFAVISNVFADAASLVIQGLYGTVVPKWIYVICGSVLMVSVTISGFKGIDKLAMYLVPLMLVFLAYAAYLSWGDIESWTRSSGSTPLSYSAAVSSVVGGYIVGVVIQPDYSRFAKNIRHAMWAAFIALWLIQALVFFLAAIPSVATGKLDLIQIMVTLGIGIPAFLLLLLSSWCSNVLCLYSSALSVSTIATRWHLHTIILAIGVSGTALAFAYSPDLFISFLVLLGISIPPIASIYVVEVIVIRRGDCRLESLADDAAVNVFAFMSWVLAIVVGYLSVNEHMVLSGISSLDTIVVATLIYTGSNVNRIRYRWNSATQ